MKKLCVLIGIISVVLLTACGKNNTVSSNATEKKEVLEAEQKDNVQEETEELGAVTPITLTIGDKVLNGYLNDSEPAKSLLAQLPLTVTLNDSDNDFCGGNLDIEYSDSDVQSGYKNGDLAFWTLANNFVIFVDDEENSADTGNLVVLGKIMESQEVLDSLEGSINVTIALAGNDSTENTENISEINDSEDIAIDNETTNNDAEVSDVRVKITVGDTELLATLEDNATTRELISQMPMTLPMMDLYGREMCYRYGAYALPTDNLQSDGYEVGDIAYWAPGGSLVILYKQNGEHFERQHLGHIDSGVEVFENIGDTDVTFEVVK